MAIQKNKHCPSFVTNEAVEENDFKDEIHVANILGLVAWVGPPHKEWNTDQLPRFMHGLYIKRNSKSRDLSEFWDEVKLRRHA